MLFRFMGKLIILSLDAEILKKTFKKAQRLPGIDQVSPVIRKAHQHHGDGGEDIGENRFLFHESVTYWERENTLLIL